MTWTLLHDACEHLDAKCIYDRCSSKGTNEPLEVDDHGANPLHILAWGDPEPKLLQTLISCCPAAVSDQDVHGDTCLHVACSYPKTPVKVVKALLDACPTLCSITNREGLMPLHSACRFAPQNEAVIGYLMEAYPAALRSHIKMGNPAPLRKRNSLTQSEPLQSMAPHFVSPHPGTNFSEIRHQSLSAQVRDGAYPLHMAVKAGAPKLVLEMLIKGACNVLLLTNKFGETPLHIALAVQAEEEVLELLIEHGRDALKMKETCHGNLPIHFAAIYGCTVPAAKSLLRHNLSSIHAENLDGKTAMDLALDYKVCSEQVLCLFESSHNAEVTEE